MVEIPDFAVLGFIDSENPVTIGAHENTIDEREVSPKDALRLPSWPVDCYIAATARPDKACEVEAPGKVNDASIDEGEFLTGFRVPGTCRSILVEHGERDPIWTKIVALDSLYVTR